MTAPSEKTNMHSPLDEASPEKTANLTIGKLFQMARLRSKTSLEKMSKDTRIRFKYLQAIEDDNFSVIPEKVVLRGFLKICAEYLALDHQQILHQYEAAQRVAAPVVHTAADTSEPGKSHEPAHETPRWVVIAGVSGLLVLCIIFWTVSRWATGTTPTPPRPASRPPVVAPVLESLVLTVVPTPSEPSATEPKKTDVINTPVIKPERDTAVIKKEKKTEAISRLTLKAVKNAWVKIVVDGKQVYHGLLSEGDIQTWTGKRSVYVRSPEPQFIYLSFNNRDLGPMSRANHLMDREFKSEPVQSLPKRE